MYRQTLQPILNQTLVDNLLAALNARPAGALFTTPSVELWTNAITPTPTSVWADFTKATFHGYAADTPVWTAPGNLSGGDQCITASATFAATSGGSLGPQTIIGYIVSDGATVVYMAERFATPVPIAAVGDFLEIDLIFPILVRPSFNV